ncbi:MAG: lipoate--protein ligase, partial [Desulfovibrionaceae bacterium]|nr:lipoate--protein ligase [Desulfovibrionaceae bacterium]
FLNKKSADPGIFLLWQNKPSVIIGRHQVTKSLIQEAYIKEHNLPVVRRISGGGAVYHDLGNLNFSFIKSIEKPFNVDVCSMLAQILLALKAIGICAEATGRNDIVVDGKKISGTSQICLGETVLFHGTLLVSANINAMSAALAIDQKKILSKGVSSIAARVQNLNQISPTKITISYLKAALLRACDCAIAQLDASLEAQAVDLANSKYRTWDWNYGASPPFTEERSTRFPWGSVCIRVDVHKGLVRHLDISGDFISLRDPSEIGDLLKGQPWQSEELTSLLRNLPWEIYFINCDPKQMLAFFTGASA